MGNRRKEDRGDTTRAKTDEFAQELYYQDSDFQIVDCITQIAEQRGVSNAQVALAWLLDQPGVIAPIIGASKLEQLEDLTKGLEVKLTAEEIAALSKPYQPHPVLGHH